MEKQRCPYCGSDKVMRRGRHPKMRYQCTDSKHPEGKSRYFYGERSVARVLVFDIETLPIQFWGWKLYDKILSPDFIKQDWCVLAYAAKWLFEPKHMSGILTPKEAAAYNDKRLVEEIHGLFEKADVIIAHNGDYFDIPRMNTRFLYYDMDIPSPYQTIDTRATAARALGMTSNGLDYLGRYFGLGRKSHDNDIDLWVRCYEGDKAALEEMHSYNVRDMYLLEDVYVKLRPAIKHPNMSLYMSLEKDQNVCPRCGHDELDEIGSYRTTAGVFDSFRCTNCGGIGRKKTRSYTTNVRGL